MVRTRCRRLPTLAALGCVCVVLAPARLSAQTQAVTGWSWAAQMSTDNYDRTYGWNFSVTRTLQVTELGFYDLEGDGLHTSHRVSIWEDGVSQRLIDGIVSEDAAGSGHWRWVSVTPTLLVAGRNYVIGAYYARVYPQPSDYLCYGPLDVGWDPAIVSGGEARYADGDVLPNVSSYGARPAVFGPNFRFGDPVPEPATIQLPALLALGGAWAWWRRSRA